MLVAFEHDEPLAAGVSGQPLWRQAPEVVTATTRREAESIAESGYPGQRLSVVPMRFWVPFELETETVTRRRRVA